MSFTTTNDWYVRADKVTGRISGAYLTSSELLDRDRIGENEHFMIVWRKPNFEVDLYVDFQTGEMASEPFVKAISKD